MTRRSQARPDRAAAPEPYPRRILTEVELARIEGRQERWIRFGRIAAERRHGGHTRVVGFRPGATFAFVCWSANDFGTVHSSIQIVTAVRAGEPYTTLPFVRPGAEILLSITGRVKVKQVLTAVDAVEAAGVDPCDASPDHWRHVGNRLEAGLAFRPYGAERHTAWLRRRAIEL